jgi:hypothetical protein
MQDRERLVAVVQNELKTDPRTSHLTPPSDDTVKYVLSKSIGAASRHDGTAKGRPVSKKKRGACLKAHKVSVSCVRHN